MHLLINLQNTNSLLTKKAAVFLHVDTVYCRTADVVDMKQMESLSFVSPQYSPLLQKLEPRVQWQLSITGTNNMKQLIKIWLIVQGLTWA